MKIVLADRNLWRWHHAVGSAKVVGEPFLLLKDGCCFRDDVMRIRQRCRLSPHVVFEADQFDRSMAMVEAGPGLSWISEMTVLRFGPS